MNESTEHLERVTQGLMQACDEVNANYRESMDVAVEATSALAKGCEEFSRNLGSLMQEQMARAMSTGKTMMSARSIQEVSNLQTEFMKDCLDQWMAGTGRLSEISARMTHEAFEPVARHTSDAMNKAAKKAQEGRVT